MSGPIDLDEPIEALHGLTPEKAQAQAAKNIAYFKTIEKWHRWFAWYPVQKNDGKVVWLKTIERIGQVEVTTDNLMYLVHWGYRDVSF